jgi:vitamin B12 transporter
LFSLFALAERAARAQDADGIDEVEVSAKRERPRVPDPTASTTSIDAARLQRAKDRGEDVGQLADTVAGTRVIDLGGPVGDRRLTVRGGSPAEAAVIVDGVRIDSPFATGFDLGQLALEGLESVEMVRGGGGASLGDGALTGALVLRTFAPTDELRQSMLMSYGSFRTARVFASGSLRPVAVSASFERTDGDFPYTSHIAGLPDVGLIRLNNDAKRGTLSLRTESTFGDSKLSLSAGASMREAGVPGLETQADLFAREKRGSALARAQLHTPFDGDRGEWTLGASANVLGIDYDDDDPSGLHAMHSRTRFITGGTDADIALRLFDLHLARARAQIGAEHSDSTEHGTPSRFRGSAALSDEVVLSGVTIYGALRTEMITGQDAAILPRAGLVVEPAEAITVRVGAGRSVRTPAIDEIYHPSENGFSGNPDLRSESAWEAEAAVALRVADVLLLTLTTFGRLVQQTILYLNRNAFLIRPENVGDSRAVGEELEARVTERVGPLSIRTDVAASVLASELAATGRPLPTQPSWSLAGEIVVALDRFELASALRQLSATTANLQGTVEVPAYLRWDEVVTIRVIESAAVTLSVLNVLDERRLESVQKVPLPGRTVFASVRVQGGP